LQVATNPENNSPEARRMAFDDFFSGTLEELNQDATFAELVRNALCQLFYRYLKSREST
jgi:hypothetical protein